MPRCHPLTMSGGGAVTKLPGGGLAQPIITNLELTAANQSAPVRSNLRIGGNAVRGAATRCFTSLRCNVALAAGAAGLQALLDGIGWVMVDGAKLQKPTGSSDWGVSANPVAVNSPLSCFNEPGNYKCPPRGLTDEVHVFTLNISGGSSFQYYCKPFFNGHPLSGFQPSIYCQYGGSLAAPSLDYVDASIADIESAFSSYDPEPSDLPFLSPGVDLTDPDVDLDITETPSFQLPFSTQTIYDAAGNPAEVQDTNIWHDFAPVDNPGKQPGLRDVETEKIDRYGPGGEPLGGATTVVTRPPASPGVQPIESPVDCNLMPTLCKWLDWTQDGWEDPDEPDLEGLRQVIDLREYDESVVIGPGMMACPEPLALYVPYLDVEVGISYQPFCDLADLLNPLLIALAYFGGAVLLVRSI